MDLRDRVSEDLQEHFGGKRTSPPMDPTLARTLEDLQEHFKGVPDVAVSSSGTPLPDWSVGRQVLDSLTNGQLTRDVPKAARAKAEWEHEHPGDAVILNTVPPAALSAIMATAAGRAMMTATEIAGVPALGEFLTGLAGRGMAGARGMLARTGSQATSGSWQGALASGLYPDEGEDTSSNLLRGMGLGAGTNILSRIPTAALRSNVSPRVAELAQRYRDAGVPLHTAQVPGASWAARAASSLFHLGHSDNEALTRRFVASMVHDASALDQPTLDAAQAKIGHTLSNAASGVGNMGDQRLVGDLLALHGKSANYLDDNARRQAEKLTGQVFDAVVNGRLNGTTYQNYTQKGGMLANAIDRTSPIRPYAMELRSALDDALERANPQAADDIRLARNQWRNSKLGEDLLGTKGGVDENGQVNPKKLFSLVANNYDTTGKATQAAARAGNPVDIGTLAEGANAFPSQRGAGAFTYGTLGAAGLALGGLGHEFGPEIGVLAGEHPFTTGALAGLGGLYAAGGLLQNAQRGPFGLNAMLRDAQQPTFRGSLAVPFVNQLYKGGQALSPETAETEAYIRSAASKRGIDPDIAVRVARSEGLGDSYTGDEGSSFGPFQLHYGGVPGTSKGNRVSGLGDEFTAKTGLHASDPSTTRDQIDFSLDHARAHGWGAWHGWKGDEYAGIGEVPQVTVPVPYGGESAAPSTTGNLLTGGQ